MTTRKKPMIYAVYRVLPNAAGAAISILIGMFASKKEAQEARDAAFRRGSITRVVDPNGKPTRLL